MKKLFYSLFLIQGITFSLYFGAWSLKDYLALEQAVAAKSDHAEMRHRINVGFEGVWYLLSNMIIISSIQGLSSNKNKDKNLKVD